jgi:hypothetical protein
VGDDEDDIEEAVSRGIERGVGNVVTTVAEVYVLGGCLLLILKPSTSRCSRSW